MSMMHGSLGGLSGASTARERTTCDVSDMALRRSHSYVSRAMPPSIRIALAFAVALVACAPAPKPRPRAASPTVVLPVRMIEDRFFLETTTKTGAALSLYLDS